MAHHVSERTRARLYANLISLVPFLALMASGLVLQVEYHLHHVPDTAPAFGLDRHGWLALHKTAAVISLACMAHHCAHHWRFIASVTKKKLYRKKISRAMVSYYLFIIFIPTALTALVSWLFLTGHARFMIVEIHDKLALLLTAVFLTHLATRAGSMVKIYRSLISEKEGGTSLP